MTVTAVGFFDGVHRGHQAILARALSAARRYGISSAALTFAEHPARTLQPDLAPDAITSPRHRRELLAATGLDQVVVRDFTADYAAQSPEWFVRDELMAALGTQRVVIGADFRFGAQAAGDAEMLHKLGTRYGMEVDVVDLLIPSSPQLPSAKVSSTGIRALIRDGDVVAAAQELGRPHRVEGTVVVGDRRGRQLGYPTANLDPGYPAALPADGVYAGRLIRITDQASWAAAVSVGTNPTFEGTRRRRVEAYCLDAEQGLDLYGLVVGVEFHAMLRGMVTFANTQQLTARMADDVRRVRAAVRPPRQPSPPDALG
jgi:riboflavin kinase / FMN adenylyltransferase